MFGSYGCGKKWLQVCLNVTETDSFTSSEKCLVYLLICWVCLKQYIGQAVDKFQKRWNNNPMIENI